MKTIKLKFLAIAIFSIIILISCSKESTVPAATTVA
jgi:hypothetical protein